jgi:hypothetical protein
MIDLNIAENRKQLSEQIEADINKWCSDKYNTGHRDHLGASMMGEACSRKLWYSFRWVKKEVHEGRIQRLFQVGHEAEPRFKTYLEGIGFTVYDKADNMEQHRISAHNGHYGGSLDGIAKHPEYGEFLCEFKTNGTGAGYNDVGTKGVAKAKPKHYAQMAQYGLHYKLKYALYLIENKNDSDITVDIVELDWKLGEEMQKKAGDIIHSQVPPPKISLNDAFYDCKFCSFVDVCHHGECVEVNCRSCKYASPVENGQWFCALYANEIPKDFVAKGCDKHASINE